MIGAGQGGCNRKLVQGARTQNALGTQSVDAFGAEGAVVAAEGRERRNTALSRCSAGCRCSLAYAGCRGSQGASQRVERLAEAVYGGRRKPKGVSCRPAVAVKRVGAGDDGRAGGL